MAVEAVKEELLKIIEGLEEKELVEALDFLDFLKERKNRVAKTEFLDYIKSMADADITLSQVREELNTICGKLSDVVIFQREERT